MPAMAQVRVAEGCVPRSKSAALVPNGSPACNDKVYSLRRRSSITSHGSQASVTSRLSQWMRTSTAPFRRASRRVKHGNSPANEPIANIADVDSDPFSWTLDKRSSRQTRKVSRLAYDSLANDNKSERQTNQKIIQELSQQKQQLSLQKELVKEKQQELDSTEAELASVRALLSDTMDRLNALQNETDSIREAVKATEQRAADDRGASETVYKMFVALALEHESVLADLEENKKAKVCRQRSDEDLFGNSTECKSSNDHEDKGVEQDEDENYYLLSVDETLEKVLCDSELITLPDKRGNAQSRDMTMSPCIAAGIAC